MCCWLIGVNNNTDVQDQLASVPLAIVTEHASQHGFEVIGFADSIFVRELVVVAIERRLLAWAALIIRHAYCVDFGVLTFFPGYDILLRIGAEITVTVELEESAEQRHSFMKVRYRSVSENTKTALAVAKHKFVTMVPLRLVDGATGMHRRKAERESMVLLRGRGRRHQRAQRCAAEQ
jgi:hypothetical protein